MMMTPWSSTEWRRAAVYGLGMSGIAAARLLRSRGVEVVALDRRPAHELDLGPLADDVGFELLAGDEPETLPKGIDGVVLSPGVPLERPLLAAARGAGVAVIAEVELAFAFADGAVVAITGSNGKSTTTALAGALLAAAGFEAEVCGNIGVPLSSCVDGPPGRVFVTELSSFQLESVDTFRPRAAALLNLSPDHLDRHGDTASYLAAKARIFRRQRGDDVAVVNADDPRVAGLGVACRRRSFSRRGPVADGCFVDGGTVLEVTPDGGREEIFAVAELPLAGAHNLENAMAAALLARALGAGTADLRRGLAAFRGLPHRLERVAEIAGVSWWDDSKATNPGATIKSLEGFAAGSVHLVLGGRNKGADLAALLPAVTRAARRVYLVGEAASELGDALAGCGVELETAGDLAHAVASAARHARAGEAVVLSPACASFDQYRDFAARGDHFQRLVTAREGGSGGQEARL